MSLADLIRGKAQRDSGEVATLTVATPATVSGLSAPSVATVASVTVAKPEKRESRDAPASLWLLHFPDLDPLAVAFAPAVDHAGVLSAYPAAIAAEPMTEPPAVAVPSDLVGLFDACERIGLYGDEDRAALPAMLALDPEGTRGLIEAMHARIGRCRRCLHFRRPGMSGGYCTRRDDLAPAYGLLRELPEDGGARCDDFDEGRGAA
jgi:hypothetical protein